LFPDGDRDVNGVRVPAGDPPRWMDALVVAIGPEVAGVGAGDMVIANMFDGLPVEYEGRIFRCVPSSRVLAVLEPNERKEVAMKTSSKKPVPAKRVSKGTVKRQRIDSTGKKGK
jgi:uncharacterized protein (UPF0261 family)